MGNQNRNLLPVPSGYGKDGMGISGSAVSNSGIVAEGCLRSKGAVGLGWASGIDNMAVVWGWEVWSRGFLRHLAGFSFPVFR